MKITKFSLMFSMLSTLAFPAVAQDLFPTPRLTSPYPPDKLSITLTEDANASTSAGRSVQELITAVGGTAYIDVSLTGGERLISFQLPSTIKLGAAFRAAQTFDFGKPSRWKISRVYPPLRAYFDTVPVSVKRVFNMSSRAEVGAGESVTISGLVIPGSYAQLVVIKVRGASLSGFGVQQPLSNPTIQLYQGSTVILQNDDWTTLTPWEKELASQVCPPPDDPLETMIVSYLDPGAYTAIVRDANGGKGIALVEMYLLDWFSVFPN